MPKVSTYADAGVDRKLEEESVKALISTVKSTLKYKTQTTGDGSFAGGIEVGDMILSLATDGVGTKVLLADELGIYNTIGIDCVAMNVNDLLAAGSKPIAFVDYIAIRQPDAAKISAIVEGVVEGCNQSGIPLLGGETAILPEIIQGPENHFDLAGTALGMHNKSNPILSKSIEEGNAIIGITSSGIHSNGLTLARKVFEDAGFEDKKELLTPTRIYVDCIMNCIEAGIEIRGMAHITGGGLRNLLRLGNFHFKLQKWEIPEVFLKIQQQGSITDLEMYTTFNMGMGYVIIVNDNQVEKVLELLNHYFPAQLIGEINASDEPLVTLENLRFGGEL